MLVHPLSGGDIKMTPSPLTNIIGTVLLVDYTENNNYNDTIYTLTQSLPCRSLQMSPHLVPLWSLSPPHQLAQCSSVGHTPATQTLITLIHWPRLITEDGG